MTKPEFPQSGGSYVRNQDGTVTRQGGTEPIDAFKAATAEPEASTETEPADDAGDKSRKGK